MSESEVMALIAMRQLIVSILREYMDYFGPVGISTLTTDLQNAMCSAWAWDLILEKSEVSIQQVYAFQYIVKRLRRSLSLCQWPDPAEFPYVQRQWDTDGLLELQYMVLCHNVLSLSKSPHWHRLWFSSEESHRQFGTARWCHSGSFSATLEKKRVGRRTLTGVWPTLLGSIW